MWTFIITFLACYSAYLLWRFTGQIVSDWILAKFPKLAKFSNANNVKTP